MRPFEKESPGRSQKEPGIVLPVLSPEIKRRLDEMPLPPLLSRRPHCGLVSICGSTLAAGKTKATKALEEVLGGQVIVHQERYWENPFLQDPRQRYSSEEWFRTADVADTVRMQVYSPKALIVWDVHYRMDFLYVAADRALGAINEAEFQRLCQAYSDTASMMFKPDLEVFVNCPLPEVFRRIKKRGREFEQSQSERIVALDHLTRRWRQSVGDDPSLLDIDSQQLDYVNGDNGKRELASQVIERLRVLNPDKFGHLELPTLG